MAVVPTNGQLQALYWIPSESERPAAVQRPSGWDPSMGAAQQFAGTPGSAAETAWTAYQAYVRTLNDYGKRERAWHEDFRALTGLARNYEDRQLRGLARAARAVLAAELLGLDANEGEATTSWVDPSGAAHTVRALPEGVFQTAVGYLARAMFYDGVTRGDAAYWEKVSAVTAAWTREADGETVGADSSSALNRTPGAEFWQRGPDDHDRTRGPAGTERMVERSGAMRMIAPYVRRRLVEVAL